MNSFFRPVFPVSGFLIGAMVVSLGCRDSASVLSSEFESLRPSSDNISFVDFCSEMAPPQQLRLQRDGRVLWIGQLSSIAASGPSVYIFDENGRLGSWDFTCGEAEAINAELRAFDKSPTISVAEAQNKFGDRSKLYGTENETENEGRTRRKTRGENEGQRKRGTDTSAKPN